MRGRDVLHWMDESDLQTHPGAQQWKGSQIHERPWAAKLVYLEISDTKEAAMKREAAIKKLTRREKEALIQTEESLALVRQVTEIPFDN